MDFYLLSICVFALLHKYTTVADGKGYFLNQKVNAENAYSKCTVFGGELSGIFSKVKVQTDAPTNTLMWISARRTITDWYSYRGCYIVENGKNISTDINSVGFCSQFCQSYPVFGLGDRLCYCMSEFPIQKSASCRQTPCNGNTLDHCGTDVSILVYEKTDILGDGNCVVMTTFGYFVYYGTKDCRDKNGFICRNYDGSYIYYSELSTWNEAIGKCYERGRIISDTYLILGGATLLPDGVPAWVGVFRKEIFIWNNDRNLSSNCVAGLLDGHGEISPVSTSCNAELPVLCTEPLGVNTTNHTPFGLQPLKDLTFIIFGSVAIGVMLIFLISLISCYFFCAKQTSGVQKLENEDTTDIEDLEESNTTHTSKDTRDKDYVILEAEQDQPIQRRPPKLKTFKTRISSYYNSLLFGIKKRKYINSSADIYDHVELSTDPYNHSGKKETVHNQREAVAEIYDHVQEYEITTGMKVPSCANDDENENKYQNKSLKLENDAKRFVTKDESNGVNNGTVYYNNNSELEKLSKGLSNTDVEPYYNEDDLVSNDQTYYDAIP